MFHWSERIVLVQIIRQIGTYCPFLVFMGYMGTLIFNFKGQSSVFLIQIPQLPLI